MARHLDSRDACADDRSAAHPPAGSCLRLNSANTLLFEVMPGERVLASYEVCSEQVRLVLQQAVEWFRPFRLLSVGFGTTAQQPPSKIFCLRFHSATLFTA